MSEQGTPNKVNRPDVQGNVVQGYTYMFARFYTFKVTHPASARAELATLAKQVTTSAIRKKEDKPAATFNLAFSFAGLEALGVPTSSLDQFPTAFRMGMKRRAAILGDTGSSSPTQWAEAWQTDDHDMLSSIYANDFAILAAREADLMASTRNGFARVASEHCNVLSCFGEPARVDHFGFQDGFSQMEIDGCDLPSTKGHGKLLPTGGWAPVAAGELIYGYRDEAGEIAVGPRPAELSTNGTFLAFRKLRENVKEFRDYLASEGKKYPGGPQKLAAKFVGRWRDGTPLVLSPDKPDQSLAADDQKNNDFKFSGDPDGARCPLGAHIRRVRPRDAMGFAGKLNDRRRLMRRGIPYGSQVPEGQEPDDTERGIMFLVFNVDIERQFEFVQQQWVDYGNHFGQGNDKDVLIGSHNGQGKAVIQAEGDGVPYLCLNLPRFVDMRGGEYFFVPGVRALAWIAALNS